MRIFVAILLVLGAGFLAAGGGPSAAAGVQRLFDQAAKGLVQLYSDMEGPQVRN